MLTQEYLKSILHYSPETGDFTWKISNSNRIKVGDIAGAVNLSHTGKKYIRISIDGKLYMAHRLASLYMNGEWPKHQIDHEDGNGLHNWWDNLRQATNSQNQRNARMLKNNTSGIRGVCFNKERRLWDVRIGANNKCVRVGMYEDKFEAICARKSAERKFNYHENHGQVRPL